MENQNQILEKNKIKIKKPNQYHVMMHNDDYTTMEFVVEVLETVFNKKEVEAEGIMLDVHKKGKGIAGTYAYDIALTKMAIGLDMAKQEGFPFKLTLEEA